MTCACLATLHDTEFLVVSSTAQSVSEKHMKLLGGVLLGFVDPHLNQVLQHGFGHPNQLQLVGDSG